MPDQTVEPLTRHHLETFVFDPHRAAEQAVAAMAHELIAARARITELETERDKGYRDRAEVIAVLAAIFPSRMADPSDDTGWPVLYLDTPEGQLSWHINPGDLDLFRTEAYALALDEDPDSAPVWDGHTNEQKSTRLHRLATCYQPADFLVDQHESDVLRARINELEAERLPRFSQRQFMQAIRDRDEAQTRAADLAETCADFINERVEYVRALRDSADETADYHRWTGGGEARRQLAERLGWTTPYESGDKTTPKGDIHA